MFLIMYNNITGLMLRAPQTYKWPVQKRTHKRNRHLEKKFFCVFSDFDFDFIFIDNFFKSRQCKI